MHQTLRQPYTDSYLQCAYVLAVACATPGGADVTRVADALRAIAAAFPSARGRSAWGAALAAVLPYGVPPTHTQLVAAVCEAHRGLFEHGLSSTPPFRQGVSEVRRVFDAPTWYADQTRWGGLVWFVIHHLARFGRLQALWPTLSPSSVPLACCAAMVMAISAAVPCSVCREHAKDTVPDQLERLAARGVTDPLDWTWHLREAVRTTRARRDPPASPMAWPPTAGELRDTLERDPRLRPPCD